jgi:hypothetical protein
VSDLPPEIAAASGAVWAVGASTLFVGECGGCRVLWVIGFSLKPLLFGVSVFSLRVRSAKLCIVRSARKRLRDGRNVLRCFGDAFPPYDVRHPQGSLTGSTVGCL